jgi:hypothetical protein
MIILAGGIEIEDADVLCLENDLLDIEQWIRAALLGKINNCKKRLISEWMPRLISDMDVDTIPADEDGLINMITTRPEYQNRAKREDSIA